MTKKKTPTLEYRVPGTPPRITCNHRNTILDEHHGLRCNRRHGHGGRHAYILWGLNGLVRAVWATDHDTRVEAA